MTKLAATINTPTLPRAESEYDARNEAEFRRAVQDALAVIAGTIVTGDRIEDGTIDDTKLTDTPEFLGLTVAESTGADEKSEVLHDKIRFSDAAGAVDWIMERVSPAGFSADSFRVRRNTGGDYIIDVGASALFALIAERLSVRPASGEQKVDVVPDAAGVEIRLFDDNAGSPDQVGSLKGSLTAVELGADDGYLRLYSDAAGGYVGITCGASGTQPDDASTVAVNLDEATNELEFVARYADGTTVKSGKVPLS